MQLAVFTLIDPAEGHGLGRRTQPETLRQSTAMAIHTLWLAARAENIGVGMVSILDPRAIERLLERARQAGNYRPICASAMPNSWTIRRCCIASAGRKIFLLRGTCVKQSGIGKPFFGNNPPLHGVVFAILCLAPL